MLKTGANVVAADLLHDLLLIAYQGQLYVQPTPDAEPLAVFDAQEVQRVLAAEGENRQTLAVAGEAVNQDVMADAARLPRRGQARLPRRGQARLADRQLQASLGKEKPC